MIKTEAPELRDVQVDQLLNEWVPDPRMPKPGGHRRDAPDDSGSSAGRQAEGALPSDVLLTMVRQFAAYSTGELTAEEEAELSIEVPDWQNRYWELFSSVIRKLISMYAKGTISDRDFWSGVYDELGIDASGPPSGT